MENSPADAPPPLSELLALASRYYGLIPRYTSYPTAAQFTADIGPQTMAKWLEEIPEGAPLSLYFHVPFCDQLCGFCACNTSVVRQPEIRSAYAGLLTEELDRAARKLKNPHSYKITHLHWGGGTPTSLPPEAISRVMTAVREHFPLAENAEISIELDPRNIPENCAQHLAAEGFSRVSLGVQDINPGVQRAAGRIQSLEMTANCIGKMRAAGIGSINIDLIYGLPRQTEKSVGETALAIAALKPDRLAVFGYAHVPWKQKRQTLIDEAALPGPEERIAQRQIIDSRLRQCGYIPVGLDHYVLPGDGMAKALADKTLHRNFQGYTTDQADTLIGIGASAISAFPQGLAQNPPSARAYREALEKGAATGMPPTWRGVAKTPADRLRGRIIERLMSLLEADPIAMAQEFGEGFEGERFERELAALRPMMADGLVRLEGSRISITEKGRPFLRNIAALFDQHLKEQSGAGPRYSSAF